MTEEDCITKCLEDKMEDCMDKCKDAQEAKKAKEAPKPSGLSDDWVGRHNIITRIMALSVTIMFIYSFLKPLAIGYVEVVSYVLLFVILIITFGLNSLKVLGTLIDKWKR